MANKLVLIGWLMAAATLFAGCAADTYTVGDDLGWTIPPLGNVAYRTWADKKDFNLGDSIIFRWSGTHDVVQVTKEGYDNCTATNTTALSPVQTTSPYNFTLNSNGPYYFICTINNHCSLGQKLTIQTEASAAAPILKTGALSALLLAVAAFISL
ncbi:Umecyanin [Sesamum angolense]|uniref:Umecyanin n=1 Tax=Sesamum angolense TaxID=2727404 RepID=A0AAE1WZM5_9LAMI|nr:Umecyanin [Sesamum angolense]